MWADLMERLADRLGRQIRYGGAPVPPAGVSEAQAGAVVAMMMSASDSWARDEAAADHLTFPAAELPVDRITEEAWNRISALLRQSGIDL
jgi:hypothetical protein